jgi:O-methyltransferase
MRFLRGPIWVFKRFGYLLSVKKIVERKFPVELSREECDIIMEVIESNLTMVSFERLVATALACKYVEENAVQGDFVECGVWRGGNSILATKLFNLYGSTRNIWLFDTFAGMSEPTEVDKDARGIPAIHKYLGSRSKGYNEWAYASLNDVKHQFEIRGLLKPNVLFVEGDVAETLKGENLPSQISILRLDTDWYESTKAELEELYPRVVTGGCLIIDDYGHWQGSKLAVDEYFEKNKNRPFFQYTDYTGRAGIKLETN